MNPQMPSKSVLSEPRWTLLNIGLFQVGWLICVLLRNEVALLITIGFAALHLYLSNRRSEDALLVVIALALGFAHEYLALQLGFYQLITTHDWMMLGQVPVWLLQLWLLFALTLNHSLAWLTKVPLWAGAGGGLFAPLSYVAGEKLGLIELANHGYLWLGGIWCLSMMILSAACMGVQRTIAARSNRIRETI